MSCGQGMSSRRTSNNSSWLSDEVVEHILRNLESTSDRASASEVSKQWYLAEGATREQVVVRFPYVVQPWSLCRRFTKLKSLVIKGKPRICEYGLLVNNWGASADAWILELALSKSCRSFYPSFASIQLRRMDISDAGLIALAQTFPSLEVLKLKKCAGFSVVGLEAVTRRCRNLKVLCLEESFIENEGNEWLQELIRNQSSPLERLNISLTGLEIRNVKDLVALLQTCKKLSSLKLGEVHASDEDIPLMKQALHSSVSLRKVFLACSETVRRHLVLPKTLINLGGEFAAPLDPELSSALRKLDLMLTTTLDTEDQREVIKFCPNLEELKVRNVIGDDGLITIASSCKKLTRIRVENLEDQHGFVSQRGLISLASSCSSLRCVAIYTSDLTNEALTTFGRCCPHLRDFRIAVLDSPDPMSDSVVDDGAKALLQGCPELRRLYLYVKLGGISDAGLAALSALVGRLKHILIGCAGNSDAGFLDFASGCHSLQKLELRHCPFTEAAITAGVSKMKKLKYIWCQGWKAVKTKDLAQMGAHWNVEYIPAPVQSKVQFVAYKSLCGPRENIPDEVLQLT